MAKNTQNDDVTVEATVEPETRAEASVSRKKSGGLLSTRNITFAALLAATAAVGAEVYRNPEILGTSKLAKTPNVDATPAGQQLADSPRYQENLDQTNQQNAQLAVDQEKSFIATPDEPLRDIDGPKIEPIKNTNKPLPPANEPQVVEIERQTIPTVNRQPVTQQRETRPQPPAGPDYSRINQLAQLMASQQQGLIGAWNPQASQSVIVVEQDLYTKPNTEADNNPARQEAINTSNNLFGGPTVIKAPESLEPPLARAGDVVLAFTLITNDTDTPGPVAAEIRSGDLKGTRLIGSYEKNGSGRYMLVKFSTAILPDGTNLPVDAYAVDPSQKSLAVRTEVDGRYFQRYAPRIAASFITGLGDALQQTGQSVVSLGDGTLAVVTPEATFKQGVYSGLAEVGTGLSDELVKSAPSGPLVTLRNRQIIGVFFAANVENVKG